MFFYYNNGIDSNAIVWIDADGVVWGIPKDEANTDYLRYLDWCAAGNTAAQWHGN